MNIENIVKLLKSDLREDIILGYELITTRYPGTYKEILEKYQINLWKTYSMEAICVAWPNSEGSYTYTQVALK